MHGENGSKKLVIVKVSVFFMWRRLKAGADYQNHLARRH